VGVEGEKFLLCRRLPVIPEDLFPVSDYRSVGFHRAGRDHGHPPINALWAIDLPLSPAAAAQWGESK
jgi:hypothetical protein